MKEGSELLLDSIIEKFKINQYGKFIDDPRITPIGKYLRKYWVDETPQIINLIKGEMKLVGIRPKTEKSWERYPRELMYESLKQKPGLFGIQYSNIKDENAGFKEYLSSIEKYLNEYSIDPIGTDRKYLIRIIHNIIFNGVRSQ